ncbi:MAG: PspC domain-containing protein [Flavobacteriaceae bacterium]
MNTTLNINLGGQHFIIDKAAHEHLHQYLEAIKNHFQDQNIRDEILSDIESRIAELFNERAIHERQVISIEDVRYIIEIMGQPSAFKMDAEEPSQEETNTHKRKLFRDPDDKILSGVAAGVAHYFGLEVKWVRLIWLLLGLFSWGGFVLIYLILWIALSKANTAAEKLKMRGEPINVSNLEKKIKEGIDEVTQRVKNTDFEAAEQKIRSKSKRFYDVLSKSFHKLIRYITKFFGVILVVISLAALFSLFISFFTIGLYELFNISWGDPNWPPIDIVHMGIPLWWAVVPTLIVCAVPMIYVLMFGKWLINPKRVYTTRWHLLLLGVWMLSIMLTIGVGLRYVSGFI